MLIFPIYKNMMDDSVTTNISCYFLLGPETPSKDCVNSVKYLQIWLKRMDQGQI